MTETILSGSSINTFAECPKEWEYAYLWRLKRPPSYKMAVGTAAHYAIEVAMTERIKSGSYPPLEVWHDAFNEAWREETRHTKPRNDKPEESEAENWNSGMNCVRFYAKDVAPTIEPYAVEMPISFRINGYIWTGTIDLLEKLGETPEGKLRIKLRDHKFTSKRPDNPARYRWPMIGYAIGLRRKLGVVEEDVQLDYVIRNKKPVLFPVNLGGPATDEDIVDLAQEIENTMATIARGSYPPLGRDTGACAWCPYWSICPDYKGWRKKPSAT